ncbi:MAG: Gfo/Idh/MocA family oxidoreductase [Alphaproteobacteria bacterium]|nr:Gfo/Idh/MocA family oxidoreductase [Alphaproteobacteria bacterium]
MDSGSQQTFKPLRIGVVGVGSMAETIHLPMIARHPKCVLTALIDPYANEARLKDLSLTYRCPWYRTAEGAEMDLAFIVTPISNHVDVAMPLVQSGIHAFVEKPLSDGLSKAQALLDTAQSNGARVFCGQVRRFYPNIVAARTLLDTHMLDKIESVSLYFGNLYGWHRHYFSEVRTSIDEGVLFDIGAHGLDSILFAAGNALDNFQWTRAIVDNATIANDIELFGTARDNMDGSSVTIYAAMSNSVGLANVIWFKTDKGTLSLSLSNPESLIFLPNNGNSSIHLSCPEAGSTSAFSQQLETVLQCLEDNCPSIIDGGAVLSTVALLEQAQELAQSGECSWLAA